MQPMLRTKLTHDPSSMEGQGYAPIVVAVKATVTSGSGVVDVYHVPAGYYLEEAIGIITTPLDAGTVDFGIDGAPTDLIANNEWTETNLGAVALSRRTTAAYGLYFAAADTLSVTFSGACTEGEVLILLKFWDTLAILAQGVHSAVES